MSKTVFVTGATAGIGKATAYHFASQGWNLILNGRRSDRLQKISKDIQTKYKVEILNLTFDVSKKEQCIQALESHSAVFEKLNALVNNAGLARGLDPLDKGNLEDWDEMIDTNIKGLLYITRLCLPYLKKNTNSHIVNLGSVAGRWTYPGGNVYSATKFAVRALTESLRQDLHGSGVRVTNISPGLVETEFSQVRLRDTEKAKLVYQGLKVLSPEDIAESIYWCISRPSHVNIQELVIYPTDQASVTMVQRK